MPRRSKPAIEEPLREQQVTLDGEFEYDAIRITGTATAHPAGSGRLSRVLAERFDLGRARLEPLELVDARLTDVELSNATLRRVLARRVELLDCRGTGLALDAERASDVYAARCKLDYAQVHIERATGPVVFEDCSLREAVLSGDLSKAVFTGCALDGVEFAATEAKGADLRGSSLGGARGLLTLRGAIVDTEQVITAATQIAQAAGLDVRE